METINTFLIYHFGWFGLAGSSVITLGILISALAYRGRRGERYSLLNHFISELGEVGVSPAAWAFNTGMIIGGLLLVLFILGLGQAIGGILGLLSLLAGLAATLSAALVGVFPMNNLKPHVWAAMTYFRSGLVMVGLFGAAILFQPPQAQVISPWANLLSLLAIASYGSFLFLSGRKTSDDEVAVNLDPNAVAERPRLWLLTILEWAVFFSTVLWLAGVALAS
jgi:hypothetical membrane protein